MKIPGSERLHTLDDRYYYEIYPCLYDAEKYTWAAYEDTPEGHGLVHFSGAQTLNPNAEAQAYWEEHKAELQAR